MFKNLKKSHKLILTGVALLIAVVGSTYAWWTASITHEQEVTMGKFKVTATFEEPDYLDDYEPGLTVELDGTIKNDGSIPALIKVASNSQVRFNQAGSDFQPAGEAVALNLLPTNNASQGYWFKDTSNRVYALLEAGQETNVTAEATLVGEKMGNEYDDATIKILAELQATQVLDGALASEFGITFDDLSDYGSTTRSSVSGLTRLKELLAR